MRAGFDAGIEQVADRQQTLRLTSHLNGEQVADVLAGSGQAGLPVGSLQTLQPDIAEYHQGTGDKGRDGDMQGPLGPVRTQAGEQRQEQRQDQEDAQGIAGPPGEPGLQQSRGGQTLQQGQAHAADARGDQAA
ncbi:hypothetical protein D9M71_505640 [compost metagenome]